MAKGRTMEDVIMSSHDERVKGITAIIYMTMKQVCKDSTPNPILYSAAKNITTEWLASDAPEDKDDDDSGKK